MSAVPMEFGIANNMKTDRIRVGLVGLNFGRRS